MSKETSRPLEIPGTYTSCSIRVPGGYVNTAAIASSGITVSHCGDTAILGADNHNRDQVTAIALAILEVAPDAEILFY